MCPLATLMSRRQHSALCLLSDNIWLFLAPTDSSTCFSCSFFSPFRGMGGKKHLFLLPTACGDEYAIDYWRALRAVPSCCYLSIHCFRFIALYS